MFGRMFKLVAKPGRKAELIALLRWDAELARDEERDTFRMKEARRRGGEHKLKTA